MRTPKLLKTLRTLDFQGICDWLEDHDDDDLENFQADEEEFSAYIKNYLEENYPEEWAEVSAMFDDSDEEEEEVSDSEEALREKLDDMDYLDILDWKENYSDDDLNEYGLCPVDFENYLEEYLSEIYADEEED